MNLVHVHLMINHLPLLTIPMAMIFLVYALKNKNAGLQKFSLIILLLTALTVVPVFLSGEPAEEAVEHLPSVSESIVEEHEDAAKASLILTLVCGGAALLGLVSPLKPGFQKISTPLIFITCGIAIASLSYTANLGGKIRHPEIQNSTVNANSSSPESQDNSDHDD